MVTSHWTGGQYILVYWGDEVPHAVIEIEADLEDPSLSRYSIERMVSDVTAWFYEHERGIEIERVSVETSSGLR